MTDRYETWATGITAPAGHGFAVTAHDANDMPETTRALYVGGGGTIALVLASGATIALSGVPSGALLPIRASRVLATGTTATALVGLI